MTLLGHEVSAASICTGTICTISSTIQFLPCYAQSQQETASTDITHKASLIRGKHQVFVVTTPTTPTANSSTTGGHQISPNVRGKFRHFLPVLRAAREDPGVRLVVYARAHARSLHANLRGNRLFFMPPITIARRCS